MVRVSIDFSSDLSVMRNQIENGSCSFNGASVLPLKWKRRHVSAVRDFPRGCGPILQPIHVVHQKAEASSLLVNDNGAINESKSTEDGNAELVIEPLKVEMTNGDASNSVDEVVQSVLKDLNLFLPTQGIEDNGDSVIKEVIIPKTKFSRRRVSAVRDFPPFCGLNATEPTEEERKRINGGSVKDESVLKSQLVEPSDEKMQVDPNNGPQNDQTGQDLMVYTREKVLKRKSSLDDSEEKPIVAVPLQIDMNNVKKRQLDHSNILGERTLILGLFASSNSPLKNDDTTKTSTPKTKKSKSKSSPKGNTSTTISPKKKSTKKKPKKVPYTGTLDMVVRNEDDFFLETETYQESEKGHPTLHDVDVALPPFGPKSSNDARNKVRETLRLFQALCRKLLQGEESRTKEQSESKPKRVDLEARKILLEKGRAPDRGKKRYGPIPGVEVGDEFLYRVELELVGIHRRLQDGIDYYKQGKDLIASSVVASGGYDNEVEKPDCLTYSGSGGITKDKKVEDQKLERGNLALKNNIDLKIPVRVIRGYKTKPTESSKATTTYIYDGLYTVQSFDKKPGPLHNLVYKFELKRIPGQPELALREVKSKKFKTRQGLCVEDISNGKEVFKICAINTINDEKPPLFNYITKIVYPDWYKPILPKGCECVSKCNKKCPCAIKNGGEVPYNHNGAIVEAKPLVYECGPTCKCPPNCHNRVTQNGMKIPLEIFKTESRGWGVRSLKSIPSGSFICEYIGELLEDVEAEKRTGNDEYLFDIGQNYNDCGDVEESDGFTIDAAYFGNIGRFINHSCSPNLYAQNVLYDQEDKRMPHIMLFAAENISPLQELTYHYNYAVDTVHDSDGNIKVKSCYCGSSECTGRLY